MRRIYLLLGLTILALGTLALGSWSAFARPTNPAAVPAAFSVSAGDMDLSLAGVPLRQNWWANTPDIDPATKMSRSLMAQFSSEGADANIGFMVYMRAQADTSNSITDWNTKGEYVLRQLETVANATQPSLMQMINGQEAAGKVSKVTQFTIVNAVFVHGTYDAATEIARRNDVAFVKADHRYYPLNNGASVVDALAAAVEESPNTVELGVQRVHAPQVWAQGYRGDDIIVGSIDSGVQYNHPALVRQYRGNLGGGNFDHNYNWYDARVDAPPQNVPYDDYGHGTHTTGTVLGDDGDPGTNQIGVAPHAKWIAAKVFPAGGSSGNEEITTAQDFMLAPWDLNRQNRRPDLRPRVINNSWGDSECWNTDSWLITQAWIDAGIMPVFSNGNSGASAGSVGSPGAYPFLIGVGAINPATDVIASFSSRGPTCFGGGIKPDVVAPGVATRSSVPGGGYGLNQGTSMAAPHVSGVAALILDANPNLTYTDVMGIMTRTAYFAPSWGTRPNNNYGWGLVQADAAVEMALHGPHVSGSVTANSQPLGGAMVTAMRTSDNDTYRTQVRADGTYSMTVLAGTYDVTASAFGYISQTLSAQQFMTDTSPVLNFTLTPQQTYAVNGQLFMNGSCAPISGTVMIEPPGMVVQNTMPSGAYSVNLPAGTYTFTARAGIGYEPIVRVVNVSGARMEDFTFGPAYDNTYVVDMPAYNWIAGDTQLTFDNGEDGYSAVTLPFSVGYYTGTYTTMNVSTNGYATFNDLTFARMWANTAIPNPGPTADNPSYKYPNNALYPYWDDMTVAPRAYGNVYTGLSGSAPNRVFVIEWRGVAGAGAPTTFEIQIEETSNRITFVYQDVEAPYGYGYSATLGIENANGTEGIQLGFNEPGIIGNMMALRFTPGTPPIINPCSGATATPQASATSQATVTAPPATPTAGATATACTITFSDVPPGHTFYPFIRCLACRGIINGYPDGTFKPDNLVTRGQLSKIVSQSAGFTEPVSGQTFEDVVPGSTFYDYVERLASREVMGGYVCGVDPSEPCVGPENRPYFRPNAGATRGQLTKIVSNAAGFNDTIPDTQYQFTDVEPGSTFWLYVERLLLNRPGVMSGYPCGGPGEPCDSENRPYFRPGNPLTRGQTSKIVANTFFPNCQTPAR